MAWQALSDVSFWAALVGKYFANFKAFFFSVSSSVASENKEKPHVAKISIKNEKNLFIYDAKSREVWRCESNGYPAEKNGDLSWKQVNEES